LAASLLDPRKEFRILLGSLAVLIVNYYRSQRHSAACHNIPMDDREAGRYWDENAASWIHLSTRGYDRYRDLLNTPAFFDLLPDVEGLSGLDIGSGDGHNTRLLGERGARMSAVDVSETFVRYSSGQTGGIRFSIASAQALPFADGTFDFATAIMSLMDIPRPEQGVLEAARILKPGGFLQYSILHPCTNPPYRRLLRNLQREAYAIEIGQYFENIDGQIDEFLFSGAPKEAKVGLRPFRIPRFHRTLAEWLNMTIDAGLRIERVTEPHATRELAEREPFIADTRVGPYFLHVRSRKAYP
jgi:SAM-dependent methyltransferase